MYTLLPSYGLYYFEVLFVFTIKKKTAIEFCDFI